MNDNDNNIIINPHLSPLCTLVDRMRVIIRSKLNVTYYQSAKDSGIRAEIIKRSEYQPTLGSAATLLQLLQYYNSYFHGAFIHTLKDVYNLD